MNTLVSTKLLAASDFNQGTTDSTRHYYYSIDAGATSTAFTARAYRYDLRNGSLQIWNNDFSINQDGTVDGYVYFSDENNSYTPSNVFR